MCNHKVKLDVNHSGRGLVCAEEGVNDESFLRSNIPQSDKLRGRCDQLSPLSPPGFVSNLPRFHSPSVSRWAFGEKKGRQKLPRGSPSSLCLHLGSSLLFYRILSYRFLSLGIKRALSDLPSLPCSLRFLSPFPSFLSFPLNLFLPIQFPHPCLLHTFFVVWAGFVFFLFSSLCFFSPL